ncbi:coatomer subunit beta-like [Convolutriloba macropyga]|uniref:coatomer subunit beta-like n=1 Tax=Convolutriloba macropyga TaxID=536237 RepID=UPI003F528E44
MTSTDQVCYTLIAPASGETVSEMTLKEELENQDPKKKAEALKKVMRLMLNGEKFPSLLMTIIRFALPCQDHQVKKLLLIFFEIVPKTSSDGKLLPEFILVCDAYRKDLNHPNEYIRGSVLRFLCKLKEPELLEPLMPAIRACLEHRHSYVRRNAVLAIFTIYKNFDFLIQDAPDLIFSYLEGEQDLSCKRNAFIMLIQTDTDKALNYLDSCIDQVSSFGDILQLVIVELIYKVCFSNPAERARFIRCIYNLLNSTSAAVRYEAAGTLVTLSGAPTAVKAAASCYIELIVKESDNNVKLIVLDRLIDLKDDPNHERILQELVMDILRVLSAPDLEVRRKTLSLALDLVSSRNVEELVLVLKKEVQKTLASAGSAVQDDVGKYRQLLVRTLHQCGIKFPDINPIIMPLLLDLIGDENEAAAQDVLVYVREAVQRFPNLKNNLVQKLLSEFNTVRNANIFRSAVWILGEYCSTTEEIQGSMHAISRSLGDIPILETELRKDENESGAHNEDEESSYAQKRVTDMGTYASQSAYTSSQSGSKKEPERPPLRHLLFEGNFFVGASLATCLTKMALKYISLVPDPRKQHRFVAECMLTLTTILHFGKSSLPKKAISDDDVDRIAVCLKVLSEPSQMMSAIFGENCRSSLQLMLATLQQQEANEIAALDKKTVSVETDDAINFGQLLNRADMSNKENIFEASLLQAVGSSGKKDKVDFSSTKLNKVTQLTGFSDPIYAEAYVNVNQFDIVLDILVVNQTSDTLQNLIVEVATLGDLKLVEKPTAVNIAPLDFCNIKASVKVTSTENGIIFGNIVYDVNNTHSVVVLNDIHIDVMDYIVPASCTDVEFRKMWQEFEWENKVSVNTSITDLREYLKHLCSTTNLKCLTPEKALSGDCGFMAANLHARSIFGEDALANLSIEKLSPDAPVTGHIRLRAKSQGMALSLGDKINLSQKVGRNSTNAPPPA